MDTPERTKVAPTPLSRFEDSPVFTFISNLSPIQPVKPIDSIRITNTYQSFNYASLTSIFSSPHTTLQKDSKILTRSPLTDISRHRSSSDNVEECSLPTGVAGVQLSTCAIAEQENCTIICSVNEASTDLPDTYPSDPSSSTHAIQYDGGSPDHNTTPCYVIKMDFSLNTEHTPAELIHAVENDLESRKSLFSTETFSDQVQGKVAAECEWESMISENEESLLFFDSPMEIGTCAMVSEKARDADSENLHCLKIGNNNDKATEDPLDPITNIGVEDGAKGDPNKLSSTNQNQVDNQQPWRRCLVFEMAGTAKRNLYRDLDPNTSRSVSFKENVSSSDYPKPAIRPSACSLPGIGLHLNSLASTSKERLSSMVSRKQLISIPDSIVCFPSTIAGSNNISKFKPPDTIRNDDEDIKITFDEVLQDIVGNSEELSQDSPRKKRRKSENGGDGDGCKRCNCKKSKCLKLYCECFAAGVYCSEPCSCQGCFNKPIHEEMVLSTRKQIESRNPLAFAPKVIRSSEAGQEMTEEDIKTPASARHKRGCNCKKSSCLKKYCECYQGGVGCSVSCRCEGCKNAFGKKEGILSLAAEEIERAEEQNSSCEKATNILDEVQQNTDIQTDAYHSQKDLVSVTPFKSCSLSVDVTLMSSAKPPRSSKFSIGRSPGLFGSRTILKSDALQGEGKFEKNMNPILEDDTPDVLRSFTSPTKAVRIASPNSKRVSPPHNTIGLTPNGKGSRKLILKSIPSLPSLGCDTATENPVGHSSNSAASSSFS